MTCQKCGRQVVDSHECNGDPSYTCAVFGCGRPAAVSRGIEDDKGRTTWVKACEAHA